MSHTPSHQLRQRVLGILAAPSATRPSVRRRRIVLAALAAAWIGAVFLAAGGIRPGGRPISFLLGASIGSSVVVVGVAMVLFGPRSALGPRRRALWLAVVIPVLALFLWKISWSAQFEGGLAPWPPRVGLRCLGLSLAMGIVPVTALLWSCRLSLVRNVSLRGAAFGSLVGALCWVALDLWCPVAHPSHLLLGHVLPLAVLMGGAAVIGTLLLPIRVLDRKPSSNRNSAPSRS